MVDDSGERVFRSNRRDLLKTAVVSLAGLGVSGTVSGASRTITVEQNGTSHEVSPLSTGQTIGDFYRFYGAESHTPTGIERDDTSLLFFWEGPNGLSLVVLHDRRDDYGGGDVTFEFSGLPDDGSWVVRDDDPGNDTYFGNSRVEWHWGGRHTDGAAFRDVSGAEFTLSPSFYNGISDWQLLSGDAEDPERISLDRGSPLTVTVGGSGEQTTFETVRDEKLALASQIDSLARDFDERPDVAATLGELETGVNDGTLDEETAVEAVERMKLGENVTEELLADFGPETLGDVDPDTLVGNAPDDPEYGTATRIVQSGINILTEAVLSFFPFDKVADYLPSGLTSKIDAAKSKLSKFIDFAVDTLIGSHDDVARQIKSNSDDISQELLEAVRDEGISSGAELAQQQANETTGILDTLADLVVGIYEDDLRGTTIEEKLSELNDSFTPEDGSLSLSGDLDGATAGADGGIDSIDEILGQAREDFETIGDVVDVVGWLGLIAGVLIASGFLSITGATLNLALFIFTVAANLLGIATGALSMLEAVDEHHGAIDDVIGGGV